MGHASATKEGCTVKAQVLWYIVAGVLLAGIGTVHADDHHTFTIYNNTTGSVASNYRLVNGTTKYDYNGQSCDSWGPPTLSDTLAPHASTSFTVHGSANCNIVGTIGSGYFNYTVQALNPLNGQWTDIGNIQGNIAFQKNWGQWIHDDMTVGLCNVPLKCTVQRVNEFSANFFIDNPSTAASEPLTDPPPRDLVPPLVHNADVNVILHNQTPYTGWQASLSKVGDWCGDQTKATGAVYPNVSPYYYFCVTQDPLTGIFKDSDLNVVYKLVDANNNNQIVSTCTIHEHDSKPLGNRTCDNCACDGPVQAQVSKWVPGTGYTITWTVPGVEAPPPTAEQKTAQLLVLLSPYHVSDEHVVARLKRYLHAAKTAASYGNHGLANDLVARVIEEADAAPDDTLPADLAQQIVAQAQGIEFSENAD